MRHPESKKKKMFCLQSLPAMSGRKRGLNQDELEVHRVLSPGSNTTVSVEEMPQSSQAPKASKSKSLSGKQISEFKDMFKSMGEFMKKVNSSGILDALDSENDENQEIDENNQDDENYDTDEEENNVD